MGSLVFKAKGTISEDPVEIEIKVSNVPSLIVKAKRLVEEVERFFDVNIPTNVALDFEIFEYRGNNALVFDYRSGKYAWIPWRKDDTDSHEFIANMSSGGIRVDPAIQLIDYNWNLMSKEDLDKWITLFSKYPAKRESIEIMRMLREKLE